jgi:hypothetical protein
MSANRKKLIATVLLSFLLCIFGCIGPAEVAQKGSQGNLPLRMLRITIDVNRREELFAQLRKFAEKHGFEILIREVQVIPEGIFIEMYRNDIKILAGDDASDPTLIELGIYDIDPKHPTSPETVDGLFSDLKSLISEVPNVTVTEEP